MSSSTPHLTEFDPTIIPFQYEVICHIRKEWDYSRGISENLLSGSVGSAKTVLAAHLVVTHALLSPGSQALIVRRTLKDLKSTFWRVMLAHFPALSQWWNKSEMKITLPNGSIIYGSSYDDGRFDKFRSYELSFVCMEEATECEDAELYNELFMRLGRLPHVKENVMLIVTNPGSPAHWIYSTFIEKPTDTRRVFYSLTEQNPFLPAWYVQNLRATLDPRMARRMLRGEWIDVIGETIYYCYSEANYTKEPYKWNPTYPLDLCFDFNAALNKPMSAGIGQVINGHYHLGKVLTINGARTGDMCEEIINTGIIDQFSTIRLFGDASGSHRDTRNTRSDWDIIRKAFQNYKTRDGRSLTVQYEVPLANPAIRSRHNLMNSLFKNDLGQSRFTIYRDAAQADKGFKLTNFKKGGNMVEDDSLPEQHITTAAGYWAHRVDNVRKPSPIQFG